MAEPQDDARYVVVRNTRRPGGGFEDQVEYVRPVTLAVADEQAAHLRDVAVRGGRDEDTYRICELRNIGPGSGVARVPRTDEVRHLAEVIADARLRGVAAGPWTLARMILDVGYRCQRDVRYVLLGDAVEAARWRVEHHVPARNVTQVFTNPAVLRGLSGPVEVVALPSWGRARPQVMAEVEHNLAIIRATSAEQAAADTRSYPSKEGPR